MCALYAYIAYARRLQILDALFIFFEKQTTRVFRARTQHAQLRDIAYVVLFVSPPTHVLAIRLNQCKSTVVIVLNKNELSAYIYIFSADPVSLKKKKKTSIYRRDFLIILKNAIMIPPAPLIVIVSLFAAACGSVDEFQCACGYNVWRHVSDVGKTIAAGRRWDATTSAAYGPLVQRMLLVAHGRPEPTARWLWLLDLYANDPRPPTGPAVATVLNYIANYLDAYLKICSARSVGSDMAHWPQDTFEKYVLENVTSTVQLQMQRPSNVQVVSADPQDADDFGPRALYLNDVAANGTDSLDKMLVPDVGIDWMSTADWLSHVYRLSKENWVFGTETLVLYQKKFLSTVHATVMGYVLNHVTYCQQYWLSDVKYNSNAGDDNNGMVGEYDRIWMSVGNLLDKFKLYFYLGAHKYFVTLSHVAANPGRSDDDFRRTRRTIEANILDIGNGMFGLRCDNGIRGLDAVEALPATPEKDQTLIELIALVDSNISAAEKYIKTVQELLGNVNFKIVEDFMTSTHIWLV